MRRIAYLLCLQRVQYFFFLLWWAIPRIRIWTAVEKIYIEWNHCVLKKHFKILRWRDIRTVVIRQCSRQRVLREHSCSSPCNRCNICVLPSFISSPFFFFFLTSLCRMCLTSLFASSIHLNLCTALPQNLSELRKKLNLTSSYWRQGELSAFYLYLKWE
jgi:hypothetical protein